MGVEGLIGEGVRRCPLPCLAIEAGASRREAARRFEVSPASAVCWQS